MNIIRSLWIIIIFVAVLSSFSSAITLAKEKGVIKKPNVIPGTEIPLLTAFPNYNCYRYEKYVVFAVPSGEEASADSYVVPLVKGIKEKDICNIDILQNTPFTNAVGWFLGLDGDFIFFDEGTSEGPRHLNIVSISKLKSIYETNYTSNYPLKLRKNKELLFYKVAEGRGKPSKDNCPSAVKRLQEVRREEKNENIPLEEIIYFYKLDEEKILDLKTLIEKSTGKIGCSYYQ